MGARSLVGKSPPRPKKGQAVSPTSPETSLTAAPKKPIGYMAVGQNQWSHFGVGAPILVDWDVHWGYDLDFGPWPYGPIDPTAFSSPKLSFGLEGGDGHAVGAHHRAAEGRGAQNASTRHQRAQPQVVLLGKTSNETRRASP